MKWADYFDRQWNWNESTKVARIASLTDFSSAAEVVDAAVCFQKPENASLLIRKALQSGVRFTPEDILDLAGMIDDSTFETAVLQRQGDFTSEQFGLLEGYCLNDNLLSSVANDAGIRRDGCFDDVVKPAENESIVIAQPVRRRIGLFSLIAQISDDVRKEKRNAGRCSGDCANCPDHYGYRYGRWYYGKHHSSGCEFGGNDCSGKP